MKGIENPFQLKVLEPIELVIPEKTKPKEVISEEMQGMSETQRKSVLLQRKIRDVSQNKIMSFR